MVLGVGGAAVLLLRGRAGDELDRNRTETGYGAPNIIFLRRSGFESNGVLSARHLKTEAVSVIARPLDASRHDRTCNICAPCPDLAGLQKGCCRKGGVDGMTIRQTYGEMRRAARQL